jgi:hypothetical protein
MSGRTPNRFMIQLIPKIFAYELFVLTCATYDNVVSEGLYNIYL